MSAKRRPNHQSGGINIDNSNVSVGGDMIGGDKTTTSGVSGAELVEISKLFRNVQQQIETRAPDPNVDKDELKEVVGRIETEVKKGEQANPSKIERWLVFLAGMAEDIFQVTAAALSHPAAGIAKAVQLIARKAQEQHGKKQAV